MAEVDFDRFEADSPLGVSHGVMARTVSLVAAGLSVALVLGLGAWGYKLAVRDVSGVPVVRAMEGPMRVAPEAPGGEIAAHMGLAVNEVAAAGAATGPADRLVLAPAPVDLADEDLAGTLAALAAPVSGRAEGAVALELPPMPAAPSAPVTQEDAIAAALAEALGQDADAVARLSDTATALSGSLDGSGQVAEPVLRLGPGMPRGAVASAVRPRPRPGSQAEPAARANVEPTALAAAPAAEVDAASLSPGMRLVQLGAFETADLARAEWDRVAIRFGDLMAGKARVVQEAQSGGRAFWRLRAQGFESEADARRFCAVLLAEQTACIPVTLR
ncbi:MAG: SPOR domain-containing protein [Paracoccaceae bacterium]|nr:MAG: SPOR domain-containing protein [Paracoccaceae bacterium]